MKTALMILTSACGPLFAQNAAHYILQKDSWFMQECPICDNVPIPYPMTGTFDLVLVNIGDVFDFYEVRNANFASEQHKVAASGRYQLSPPFIAGLQYMRLEAAVNNETGIVFDSDFSPLDEPGPFPPIELTLIEETQSLTRKYHMRIVAVPVVAPDLDRDGDVDLDDFGQFQPCVGGPNIPTTNICKNRDFDDDNDVDQADFGVLQRCFSGPNKTPDANCAL